MRLLFLILALAAGAGAGWVALSTRSGARPTPAQAPAVAMEEVLVAARDLASGRPLGKDGLRWQAWPTSAANAHMIRRKAKPEAIEEYASFIARTTIAANEPIQTDKVGKGGGVLSHLLSPGKRAVAVKISAESTAGGFILPNDRVDVMQTVIENTSDGEKRHSTRALVRNVTVLAIDQVMEFDEKNKMKVTAVGRTATLELSPEQTEIVIAAESRGRLSLALRSAKDNAEQYVEEAAESRTIRVIRGGQAETIRIPYNAPASRADTSGTVRTN